MPAINEIRMFEQYITIESDKTATFYYTEETVIKTMTL